jgi:hypothetical protein
VLGVHPLRGTVLGAAGDLQAMSHRSTVRVSQVAIHGVDTIQVTVVVYTMLIVLASAGHRNLAGITDKHVSHVLTCSP